MMDDEKMMNIGDGLFSLRDSLDRRVRQLRDLQSALGVAEYGLEKFGDSGGASGAAVVRLLSRHLQEMETDMMCRARQIARLEAAVRETGEEWRQKK